MNIIEAKKHLPRFKSLVKDPTKIRRGVDVSEIFFIYAVLKGKSPKQIIESGRALGQSTSLLAAIFPKTCIVSIESDEKSPDAKTALTRLKPFKNVECLFGDSFALMPKRAQKGDVLVIDGPKDWKALKLAFKLIRGKKPSYVFIHDCNRDSPIRSFLEKTIPWAFYSDDHAFIQNFCHLDQYQEGEKLQKWSDPKYKPTDCSYGGTFLCIPCAANKLTAFHLIKLHLVRLVNNFSKIFSK